MFVIGLIEAPTASAAVTITKQHCSTSSSTCLDQSVDNNGEACIVARKDSNHHANWCIYDHGWTAGLGTGYVDARVETCVGYQACVGVDHFLWVNSQSYGNSQIVLWDKKPGGGYQAEEWASAAGGNTGPTDTLYTTGDWDVDGYVQCNGFSSYGVVTHTEADLKVYWKDGTHTAAINENSYDYCHPQ
jgi:hypothetical protein